MHKRAAKNVARIYRPAHVTEIREPGARARPARASTAAVLLPVPRLAPSPCGTPITARAHAPSRRCAAWRGRAALLATRTLTATPRRRRSTSGSTRWARTTTRRKPMSTTRCPFVRPSPLRSWSIGGTIWARCSRQPQTCASQRCARCVRMYLACAQSVQCALAHACAAIGLGRGLSVTDARAERSFHPAVLWTG